MEKIELQNGNESFDVQAMLKARRRIVMDANMAFWAGEPISDFDKIKERLCYAFVEIDGKKEIIFVHQDTRTAYALIDNDYYKGLVIPLQEKEYDSFVRWCSGQEL